MKRQRQLLALGVAIYMAGTVHAADVPDRRLREVSYDPHAVLTIPVRRGVVTHVALDPGEQITELGAGLGADCSKAEASWCIAAAAGGRHIFVKPKSTAAAPNNLAVVTDRRNHALRFVVLADGDRREPVYRISIRAETATKPVPPQPLAAIEPAPDPAALIAERLGSGPSLLNAEYTLAEGSASADIVPTLVFDDGRFTYLRFPGNREVPAVFQVLGDGSEAVVNARMEGDLLVVDRVSRRLVLRAGSAVVGLWNEAFDAEGLPPEGGTTVAGVRRLLKRETDDERR